MQIIKHCFKYILTFFIIVILLLCMLVLSAVIPRSSIKENVYESAIYLCEGELFGEVIEDVKGSKIDRYADSILLAIAYQYDSEQPLTSVMWSSYYYTEYQNENENLLDAVTNNYDANQQYVRYWHGSNAIVRPLLTFLNLKQIYILNGIILGLLTTETLTLTVPLLLILWVQQNQHRHENRQASIGITIKAIVAWGIGFLQYIFGAIWNNIKCLFPFEYGMIGALIGSVLVLLVLYIGYVYRGKKIDRKCVLLYALIGLIPYIRYVVLHNHSYLHCFFTYRAQMATILAIVLILEQLTDGRYPIHANRRNSKV